MCDSRSGSRRAGRTSSRRTRPPRHQAGEHRHYQPGHEAARFRARSRAVGDRSHVNLQQRWTAGGHAGLYGAGTDSERARRRENRHLCRGGPPLRARDWRAAVPRRHVRRRAAGGADRTSPGPERFGGARRHRPRRSACNGQGSARSVRVSGRDGRRAATRRRSASGRAPGTDQAPQADRCAALPPAPAGSGDRFSSPGNCRRPWHVARRPRRHRRAFGAGTAGGGGRRSRRAASRERVGCGLRAHRHRAAIGRAGSCVGSARRRRHAATPSGRSRPTVCSTICSTCRTTSRAP